MTRHWFRTLDSTEFDLGGITRINPPQLGVPGWDYGMVVLGDGRDCVVLKAEEWPAFAKLFDELRAERGDSVTKATEAQ